MKKITMDLPAMDDYQMTEGFSKLKTNLAFLGKDIKVVEMTSSIANEGKSAVSMELARRLVENNKKILLIDCDLRRSVMAVTHHMQGVEKGFSHYLSGQATMDEVIYEVDQAGFYFVPAGPLSPDPTSLLNSETFKEFMEKVREDFDFVIVDAPPVGLVIDAAIIGKYCDGAIVVIQQGTVRRNFVQGVVKQLRRGNIRVLGAVLNKVDHRGSVYGDRRYSEYYNYDYKEKEE